MALTKKASEPETNPLEEENFQLKNQLAQLQARLTLMNESEWRYQIFTLLSELNENIKATKLSAIV